ncbi:MAG: DUF885 domain-containing protein [Ornithinimicrobium sp.]
MTSPSTSAAPNTPRQLADAYVHEMADLDPSLATMLGLTTHDDRVPDFSPQGHQAIADLMTRTLSGLTDLEEAAASTGGFDELEYRCAVLLRERLTVELDAHEAGEHLREMRNIFGPPQRVRQLFSMMPTRTQQDWECVAARMAKVPHALESYAAALELGRTRGLLAAPLQVQTLADQLTDWITTGWFAEFVESGATAYPDVATRLSDAAAAAADGTGVLRDYLLSTYLDSAQGTPDPVGAERYRLNARRWTGADLDLEEAYAWGWQEFLDLRAQMEQVAEAIAPGSTPVEAMRHLDQHGEAVEGVEEIRERLQRMMDQAIEDLGGEHFDIAEPLRTVKARIAPSGSAAAPYYSRPSQDFARPGQTWLPTLGETRFPLYDLVSTWYHEGVPGHHLQLAQWVYVAPQLSLFQTSIGSSSGATEGWALYAERFMDELGYLDTEAKMGYLDCQIMRAIRVVVDIGMHLQLTIPADSDFAPGQQWTPQLATEFFAAHCGRPASFIDSEIVRYLGWPGQAISYKLGERAWLAGRAAAQEAAAERGEEFDLKAWHMAALSLGALGLDDLQAELGRL